ncbi:MAG: YraN family protein [Candidatus Calescibacterium sp.]|nr:YraN family protein [Candidatus Calescibacterium sp.]MDW8132300.1 YraN family protein [Candidatus Calescibacterium sp.]
MNKKGQFYEKLALDYLKSKKYKIIATNFISRFGEIDIIAYKDDCLVIVEVKGGSFPSERINYHKIESITKTLDIFLQKHELKFRSIRIDAIFVSKELDKFSINHIENITL